MRAVGGAHRLCDAWDHSQLWQVESDVQTAAVSTAIGPPRTKYFGRLFLIEASGDRDTLRGLSQLIFEVAAESLCRLDG
jgi:hypothetical protein